MNQVALDYQIFNVAGGAAYQQTGGTNNAPYYAISSATAASSLTSTGLFSGGTFNETGEFMVGRHNSAVMTVSGSALLSLNVFSLGQDTGYTTTCYLNGGTISLLKCTRAARPRIPPRF